jgi:hypothetical protein
MAGATKMIIKHMINWKLIFITILGFLLMPTFAAASDVFYYKIRGSIIDVKRNAISIDDGYMTFSSTIKVFDIKGNPISSYNLKKNDFVELSIQNNDNKIRVDTIRRLPDLSNQPQ